MTTPSPTPDLPDPEIEIGADGTPRSARCGDVYFSTAGGIAETRHVFLAGIDAPALWRTRRHPAIGELGFGTGLNFLVTWHDWQAAAAADATLDYIAVEGFPPDRGTLARALAPMTEVAGEAAELVAAWPARVAGLHRLVLAGGRVRLTLAFGEVSDMLSAMTAPLDAWFLDGFAPSKNPGMWTPAVLADIARLTRPGGRVATFTVAGAVRRGLASFGFEVAKRPGFAHKRDCLTAEKPGGAPPVLSAPGATAVIGAGVAGATVARVLAARGRAVTLIEDGAAGASGNPVALIAPRLPREPTPLGRLMAAAYLYAVRFYDGLAAAGAPVWIGPRGGFALARNDDERDRQSRALAAFGLPQDVMRRAEIDDARALTGADITAPGLWFEGAGALAPPAICAHLTRGMTRLTGRVVGLSPTHGGWSVHLDGGTRHEFAEVVVAAGTGLGDLLPDRRWPVRVNRGQLAYLAPLAGAPRVPVTYGGYITPPVALGEGGLGHVLGATYARPGEVPADDWQRPRADDDAAMLEHLAAHLPALGTATRIGGRTALRATVRDYLPLAGPAGPELWVLGGLGSRGFLTAPLLAEMLGDLITGAPPALPADLIRAVDPARFEGL